jgi:hypothetical protein
MHVAAMSCHDGQLLAAAVSKAILRSLPEVHTYIDQQLAAVQPHGMQMHARITQPALLRSLCIACVQALHMLVTSVSLTGCVLVLVKCSRVAVLAACQSLHVQSKASYLDLRLPAVLAPT